MARKSTSRGHPDDRPDGDGSRPHIEQLQRQLLRRKRLMHATVGTIIVLLLALLVIALFL